MSLVKREHHLDREGLDLGGSLTHLASFRSVSSRVHEPVSGGECPVNHLVRMQQAECNARW